MKRILIIPNAFKDKNLTVSSLVAKHLDELGFETLIESKFETTLNSYAKTIDTIDKDIDLIIVVGGDGSVIDASVVAVQYDLPVLGINLGKLGYLAEIEPDSIHILEKLKYNDFKIEEKMLLTVKKSGNGDEIISKRYAVNDVIVTHENFLGLSEISLTNSSEESIRYRSDGLILSTPVGSTAYSLSAGGPIVSHDINSILATPICPHSFINRSIIFKESERLQIRNIGESPLKISIDGRFFSELVKDEVCTVNSAQKKLKMLTFSENNMFSTLFSKMRKIESI